MAIIEQNPAEERPFGAFAPKAYLARIIARTRAASDSFLGRKVAYALRRLGLRSLDGAPVDIESLGAKMRLYPSGNVCEKRVLFTPQYFDAVERELLVSRLRDGFTFIDIGATHPLLQCHRVDAEVSRDLLNRDTGLTATGDADHVVTELFRVRLRHDAILPGPPPRASQIRCHLTMQQTPRCWAQGC